MIGFVKHHNGNESIAKAKKGTVPHNSARAEKTLAPRGTATAESSRARRSTGKAVRRGAIPGNAEELHGYVRRRHSVEKLSTDKREQGHGFGKLGTAKAVICLARQR